MRIFPTSAALLVASRRFARKVIFSLGSSWRTPCEPMAQATGSHWILGPNDFLDNLRPTVGGCEIR